MATGTVKWFDRQKGYGFIAQEGEEKDVFVHFSAIQMDGFKVLYDGDVVEFEVGEGTKGPVAKDVRVLKTERKPRKEKSAPARVDSVGQATGLDPTAQKALDVIHRCVDAVPTMPLSTSLKDFPGSVVMPLSRK